MKKITLGIFVVFVTLFSANFISTADEKSKETEVNFYTGLFDFSDNKQKAGLFGLQHRNEELFRESFLGKLSPITGGFLTENNAFYLYSGVQAEYELGFLTITPSFAPG